MYEALPTTAKTTGHDPFHAVPESSIPGELILDGQEHWIKRVNNLLAGEATEAKDAAQEAVTSRFHVAIPAHQCESLNEQMTSLACLQEKDIQITYIANGPEAEAVEKTILAFNETHGTTFHVMSTSIEQSSRQDHPEFASKPLAGKDVAVLTFMNSLKRTDPENYWKTNFLLLDADSIPTDPEAWYFYNVISMGTQMSEGAFAISRKLYRSGVNVRDEARNVGQRFLRKAGRAINPELNSEDSDRQDHLKESLGNVALHLQETLRTGLTFGIQNLKNRRDRKDSALGFRKYFATGEAYSFRLSKHAYDSELERLSTIEKLGGQHQIWLGEDQWRIHLAKESGISEPERTLIRSLDAAVSTETGRGKIPLHVSAARTVMAIATGRRPMSGHDEASKEKYHAQNLGMSFTGFNESGTPIFTAIDG